MPSYGNPTPPVGEGSEGQGSPKGLIIGKILSVIHIAYAVSGIKLAYNH